MDVPELDLPKLLESAAVVVLVVAVLQYLGGLLVGGSGQLDFGGLAIVAVIYLGTTVLLAIVAANTGLSVPDSLMKNETE